ncbi:MAG: O-antigen ligase family protein [Peptococcaceae bacterium]|nr:O-antigen ligase family protein [Peptococcaceae bacterium]
MSKKPAKAKETKKTAEKSLELESGAGRYIHISALWGICALLLATPFFRGLFFPEDQQKALFFAVLVFWLTWLWKWSRGDGKFLFHPLDCLVLALPAVYLVSSFNAANTGLAVNEVVKTLLYFLVYWVTANLVSGEKDAVRIFKAVCLAGAFVSLAGLAAATGMVYIKDGFLNGRIYSTFQYPNALASYLMTVIFLSLYLWLRDDKSSPAVLPDHRYLYAFVSFLAFVAFVGAKSNGGFLVFLFAVAVYFAGLPRGRRIPAVFHLAITGGPAVPCALLFVKAAAAGQYARAWIWVLAGAAAVVLLQWLYGRLEKRGLLELIGRRKALVLLLLAVFVSSLALAGASCINSHSQAVAGILEQFRMRNAVERMYFYRDALKMVAERPLLGWGGGGWQEAYRMFQGYLYNSNQVHGHYFQVAVETGVTGLLVILSVWAAFLQLTYRAVKNSRENPGRKMLLWTAFTAAVALGAHAVIDFDLSLSALSLVLWAVWGLVRGLHAGGMAAPAGGRAAKKHTPAFAAVSAFSVALLFIAGCFITASGSARDAGIRLRAGDLPGAVALMEKAAYYNPFNPDYSSDLATLYARQGRLEQAARQAEEALAKSRYSAPRHASLAGLYLGLNRTGEAVAMAERAVDLAPFQAAWYDSLARVYFTAGYNLMLKGDTAGAGEMFAKAVQVEERINRQAAGLGPLEKRLWVVAPMLAPSDYTRLYSGASLALMGDYQKAEPLLRSVSGDDRTKAEALMWLGLIYHRQGRQAESGDMMARAGALVPDAEKQFSHIFSLIKK